MDGFITESLSKITDGLGNSIKLLLFYALTTLLIIPVRNFFGQAGVLIYILVLLAVGGFELQRTLVVHTSEPRRAWHGMAAGLFFWQAIRFTTELGSLHIFEGAGILFWVIAVIFTAVLWMKVLPIGMRSAMMTLLICWLERIYQTGYGFLSNWPPVVTFSYEVLRWAAVFIGLAAMMLIIFRSYNLNRRIFCAIVIFGATLFLLLNF